MVKNVYNATTLFEGILRKTVEKTNIARNFTRNVCGDVIKVITTVISSLLLPRVLVSHAVPVSHVLFVFKFIITLRR